MAGFSALKAKTSTQLLKQRSDDTFTNNAAPYTPYYLGGLLTVGGDYFVTRHSAVGASLSYYIYSPCIIKEYVVTAGDGTSSQNVVNRKSTINLTALTFGYSYYF